MRLQAIVAGVGALALVASAGVSAQVDLGRVAKLRNPAGFTEQAPASYKANFDTSKGTFVIQVTRDWAPIGADRFYNLVNGGFYDDIRFFRVIEGFMVQFGIHGNPAVQGAWRNANLKDDPVKGSNKRGMVTFATAGPNTRTTQVFINFGNNTGLDKQGFARLRRSRPGHGRRRQAVQRLRRRRAERQGAEPGTHADGGQRVSEQGVPAARLHQGSHYREVRTEN